MVVLNVMSRALVARNDSQCEPYAGTRRITPAHGDCGEANRELSLYDLFRVVDFNATRCDSNDAS